MKYISPLRYPGGKGRFAGYFQSLLTENFLIGGQYFEPFAGGSSVALSLLINEYVTHIHINDYDYTIYCFWYSILNYTDEFNRKVYETQINVAEWERQKYINMLPMEHNILEVGFSTFFLNRTNISGIIKGGIIGGLKQLGKWKIDARFNKQELIARINRIALYSKRIKIYNDDAMSLLPKLLDKLPSNSIIYFDPPYFNKGRDLYVNFYKNDDHHKLSDAIKKIDRVSWVLSYDNVSTIRNFYSDFRQLEFNLNYHAGRVTIGSEVFIFSNNLKIPNSRKSSHF